jgi:hypothetical protein
MMAGWLCFMEQERDLRQDNTAVIKKCAVKMQRHDGNLNLRWKNQNKE